MNNLPEFDIVFQNENFVLIRDRALERNCMSVTNGAEEVVSRLYEQYNLGRKFLFYIDTEGQVDELTHEQGTFIGFAPGCEPEVMKIAMQYGAVDVKYCAVGVEHRVIVRRILHRMGYEPKR